MQFAFAIISFVSVGASAQNLRQGRVGQGRPQLPADGEPGDGTGVLPGPLPDGFSDGFPGRPGGGRPEGTPEVGRPGGDGDGIDGFLDRFNVTDGAMVPPCPPENLMERLNLTAEDLDCNPNFDFSGMFDSDFTDNIPCPPQALLDHLNLTIEDLPCNPDVEAPFGNFTGDRFPCPPQELLDQLNKTLDELPCNPDLEFPDLGNLTIGNFSDKIPCPPQEMLDQFNISQEDVTCNPDLAFGGRRPGGFQGGRPLTHPMMPGNNAEGRRSDRGGRMPQLKDPRRPEVGDLNLPGFPDGGGAAEDLLDRFNITDGLNDFLDRFNFSDGDMMPPCPPEELLGRFNMTSEDLECDPDFDFSDIVGNFSDKIPCPPYEILDHFNKSVEDLPCNPDVEFPGANFTGDNLPCPPQALLDLLNMTVDDFPCNPEIEFPGMGNFSINDLTDKIPCPSQEMLDRFNITQDDLPCNPDLEYPSRPMFERPNRTVLDCDDEPVTCALGGGLFNSNRVGVVVCRETVSAFLGGGGEPTSSRCIEPDRARDSDTCGCCGGECPQTCGCGCIMNDDGGEMGFLVENRFGFTRCVSAAQSVSYQLNGRYNCAVEDDQCLLPPTRA